MAAEMGKPVTDLEVEGALFKWLSRRSGSEIRPDVDHRVAAMRARREHRKDSAAS